MSRAAHSELLLGMVVAMEQLLCTVCPYGYYIQLPAFLLFATMKIVRSIIPWQEWTPPEGRKITVWNPRTSLTTTQGSPVTDVMHNQFTSIAAYLRFHHRLKLAPFQAITKTKRPKLYAPYCVSKISAQRFSILGPCDSC